MLTDAQVYCMTSMIYLFRPPLTAKASIGKRWKQSCTSNIKMLYVEKLLIKKFITKNIPRSGVESPDLLYEF